MTAERNLLFTLPLVILTGPSKAASFTVKPGERVVLFSRGHRITAGPVLEPGNYEVTGDIVQKDHPTFPLCIATVRYSHMGAFLALNQNEIDNLMDVVEQAITDQAAERSRPN